MDLTEIVTNTTTSLIDYQTIVDLDQGLINQDHWIINIFEYGTWLMGLMLTGNMRWRMRTFDVSTKSGQLDALRGMEDFRSILSGMYAPIFISDVFNLVSMATRRTFSFDKISHVTKFLPLTMITLMSPVGTVLEESLRFAMNGLFELFGFVMGFEEVFFKMLTNLMGLY